MKILDMVTLFNTRLKSERLPITQAMPYLDMAIDDINIQLNAKFPTITEVKLAMEADPLLTDVALADCIYDCFPDKYIRTVLTTGAAYHFFQDDEEGMQTAVALRAEYDTNMFYMVRDYSHVVPEEYQDCDMNGILGFKLDGEGGLYAKPFLP